MMRTLFKNLSILAVLVYSLSAFAGAGSSVGGADLEDYSRAAAWYLGPNAVHYCLQVSSDFGLNKSELQKDVEQAFQTWRNYVTVKNVNKGREAKYQIFINTQYQETCDGTEDLRFYFGVDAPEVLKVKEGFESPLAFAYHEDYDFDRGWTKGSTFVWLANTHGVYQNFPEWNKPGLVNATLLHEVGHIFGNEHLNGTIMDPGIGEILHYAFSEGSSGVYTPGKNGSPDQYLHGDQPWMHRIDNKVELWSCEECLKKAPIEGTSQAAQQLFEKYVGRTPLGLAQAGASLHDGKLELSFCDDKNCTPVNVRFKADGANAGSVFELTQNSFVASHSKGGGTGRHFEAGTAFFQVQDHAGNWVAMTLDFNMQTSSSASPFQVKYWSHAQRIDLMNWIPTN